MRKLSEIKDEEALEVLADLLDPISVIAKDKEIREPKVNEKGEKIPKTRTELIQLAIKRHKSAVLKILATLDGVPVEEYHISIIQIPIKIMELFNDEDMISFFESQGLMISDESSGSATENTEAVEQ